MLQVAKALKKASDRPVIVLPKEDNPTTLHMAFGESKKIIADGRVDGSLRSTSGFSTHCVPSTFTPSFATRVRNRRRVSSFVDLPIDTKRKRVGSSTTRVAREDGTDSWRGLWTNSPSHRAVVTIVFGMLSMKVSDCFRPPESQVTDALDNKPEASYAACCDEAGSSQVEPRNK